MDGDAHLALSSVTVPMRAGPYAPMQAHLSLSDHDDEMVLTYVSGGIVNAPSVRYGTLPSALTVLVTNASSVTYTASNMCESPATITSQVREECVVLREGVCHGERGVL